MPKMFCDITEVLACYKLMGKGSADALEEVTGGKEVADFSWKPVSFSMDL